MAYTLIFDIGKTNAKLHLLNEQLVCEYSVHCSNQLASDGPYPHFQTEALWHWLASRIMALDSEQKSKLSSICVTTHGATAALIDSQAPADRALVLPVLDYEHTGVEVLADKYEQYRADFSQTLSPKLPAGLNLGLQLFWLQSEFPELFAKASHILMYPQYWAWRLSGELSSEVSSLGCHTDLWNTRDQCYSTLVEKCGWRDKFPPMRSAWEVLGPLQSNLAKVWGLNSDCKVHVGVHDSNASYLRYLSRTEPFCVFSTGTWTIAMTSACDPTRLNSERDMLANTAVNGDRVACSRFMGGREYEVICSRVAEAESSVCESTLLAVLEKGCFALPNFCPGTGPYPLAQAQIVGSPKSEQAAALATLYCALMMDVQADLLAASEDIIIEGAFLKNRWLCEIFAALRSGQRVYLSADETGTVQGCAQLSVWQDQRLVAEGFEKKLLLCSEASLPALEAYRQRWRELTDLL